MNVAAGLIVEGDRFLICRRPFEKTNGGLWEFPGGKLEPGETGEQAICRELSEELGIDTTVLKEIMTAVHEYDTFTVNLTVYAVEIAAGEVTLMEHTDARWITADECDGYLFCEADREIVNRIKTEGLT